MVALCITIYANFSTIKDKQPQAYLLDVVRLMLFKIPVNFRVVFVVIVSIISLVDVHSVVSKD